MKITAKSWEKIEAHFAQKCELNERGEIVFYDKNFPVGYIAEDYPYEGYLVDTMHDRDTLICKVGE